jgi:hypothetical protein
LQPIVIDGSGDSIVDIDKPAGVALIKISGNADSRYFGVLSYDSENEELDLLVNTTKPYNGLQLLDWKDDQDTARLKVEATGAWSIEVQPFNVQYIPILDIPGSQSGKDDYLLLLRGGTPDILHVSKADRNHIAVFGGTGEGRELLLNTVGPYEGMTLLPKGTLMIEIKTVGDWEIQIETK